MERKTPLYGRHTALGGKIVPFAGYLLPIQYGGGIISEHMAVRSSCGLFDVSHMGEIELTGPGSLDALNYLLTNDFTLMETGQCRYSLMCYDSGGALDDLIVYKKGEGDYLLVVNASNRQKDFDWISARIQDFGADCQAFDLSDATAQLALQGPLAASILSRVTDDIPEKGYTFKNCAVKSGGGIKCLISRTGYTGEDGFELYCASDDAPALWDLFTELGAVPCGLGARDTLRLEASMPLYGHELSSFITPYEAVLGFFVKMEKDNFIGKDALSELNDPAQKRSGLKITGRGIAREGCTVWLGQRQAGIVTSGTHCPFLGGAYAMAMLDSDLRQPGTKLEIDIRGKRIPAETVKMPFYKR